ncbi:MAG TPA: helicase, partial [Candidatus Gemmiger excrementavium]|nr:helicase [Candidatus Gemmiger excrementavium]
MSTLNTGASATDLPTSACNAPSAPLCQADTASVTRASSPAEKIRLFRSLFRGRADVYALRWHSEKTQRSGYSPVCANEWQPGLCEKGRVSCAKCPNRVLRPLDDTAIYRHLAGRDAQGRDVIGLYPMLPDETCYLLALDFDDANWQDCARAVASVCRAHSIPFALERSRSGQGAHVWLFFAEATPCAKARQLGDALLSAAMDACGGISFTAYDRMFPNLDTLPAGGFGNLIALPLQGRARRQGNSVFLDDSLTPYPDPWAFLSTVRTLLPGQVDDLLAELCPGRPPLGALAEPAEAAGIHAPLADSSPSTSDFPTPWKPQPTHTLSTQDFKQLPLPIVRGNGLYIQKEHLTPAARNRLIRLAAFRNPDFYKKQAMHFSTHNIPRIISTAAVIDGFLVLPRGCEEALCALLQDAGADYAIQDETCPGRPLHIAFTGTLRPDQQPAADALLAYRNGVLSATTAFGKTVVAAWLIAQRGVNTLILVHTQALLNQWQAALSQFLRIDESLPPQPKRCGRQRKRCLIGQIGGGKNTAAGFVDIAMLQSLVRGGEVDLRVREYGL